MILTSEMRIALNVLHKAGVRFHATRQHELACGCIIYGGWVTAKHEPGLTANVCSPAHAEAFARAQARWRDPDVCARFAETEGYLAMAELLEEEATRGAPPR